MDERMGTNETADLHAAGERVAADFDQLREAMLQRTGEIRDTVTGFVQEHPYMAVGAAFAAGYVISGALVSRTTGRLLGFGMRFLVGAMIKQAVSGAGLGIIAGSFGESQGHARERMP